jgi:cytochrome c oxidase accessory protein FixG
MPGETIEQGARKGEKVSFRDMLHTVDDKGKRKWIYAKRPGGKLFRYRWIVAILLLSVFFAMPFIRVNGEQFFLLNVFERKFILFGQVFWPQDFHLIVLMLIALLVFIILFTVTYGRLFCGWVCPQTVFMEFVFRQIEYLIEGDHHKQKRLSRQPWNFEKIWKRGLKHTVFFGIAFIISNFFLAYFIGMDPLIALIAEGPSANTHTLAALLLFAGAFYFIFSWFREQVCMLVCPYGRLQGVLLDERTIVVAYDYRRGEPRAHRNPLENRKEQNKGDCIDCSSCITVCPTGIDIRNGTQLECVNCTACIDACNHIMDKERLPRGLIRYDSERGISTGIRKKLNPRSIAYTAFLAVLLTAVVTLFVLRSDVEVTILRIPGSMHQEYGADHYSNIYHIQLVNKTRRNMPIDLKLTGDEGEIVFIGEKIKAETGRLTEASFMVIIPKKALLSSSTPLTIGVWSQGRLITRYKTGFIGPNSLDQPQKQ